MYAHRAWLDKAKPLEPLREVTPRAIVCYKSELVWESTVGFLTDILNIWPAFFTAKDYIMISGIFRPTGRDGGDEMASCADRFLEAITSSTFDDEAPEFARLLWAYGDAKVQDLAQGIEHPDSIHILNLLIALLKIKGYAAVQDDICPQALEFWTTFV